MENNYKHEKKSQFKKKIKFYKTTNINFKKDNPML